MRTLKRGQDDAIFKTLSSSEKADVILNTMISVLNGVSDKKDSTDIAEAMGDILELMKEYGLANLVDPHKFIEANTNNTKRNGQFVVVQGE